MSAGEKLKFLFTELSDRVGLEQRGFVGLWKPHLRAQNIAANVITCLKT